MNNASSSSSHPPRNALQHQHRHQHRHQHQQRQRQATPIDNIHGSTAIEEEEDDVPLPVSTNEDNPDDPALHKRCIRRDQRIQFLDHLIRNLDMVIYCQISILYYM
ncbi:hypothetical protein MMC29_000328, partial [Sticta canariensis]|nr:hypothetical protein [Sticta canariensis]